jgi:hypothetical protein
MLPAPKPQQRSDWSHVNARLLGPSMKPLVLAFSSLSVWKHWLITIHYISAIPIVSDLLSFLRSVLDLAMSAKQAYPQGLASHHTLHYDRMQKQAGYEIAQSCRINFLCSYQ